MAISKQNLIRTKLEQKLFSDGAGLANIAKLIKKTSTIYNERGEEESFTAVESDIKIIPYNLMFHNQSYQSFGMISAGEFDAALPYDVSIEKGDRLELNSETYFVTNIEQNLLPGNVVTIARFSRLQP